MPRGWRMTGLTCPCCCGIDRSYFASEAGYNVVRCQDCGLLYVYPVPDPAAVDAAVKTGLQQLGARVVNVRSRRIPAKVAHYRRRLKPLLADVISSGKPVTWIDVGSGYGEFMEALQSVLPSGSEIKGVEPMTHKAEAAQSRGLDVTNDYLRAGQFQADFISNIDVFSHIPDYHAFLQTVVTNLKPGGQVVIETGNAADVGERKLLPNELGLPDHLVFAGKSTMARYFREAGLEVIETTEERFDTATQMAKNAIKVLLGRPAVVRLPYTSTYRQLIFRAKLI